MGASSFNLSRRGFLLGAGAGLAAGVPLTLWAEKPLRQIAGEVLTPFSGVTKEESRPAYAMPGPFPGRVIEVRRPDAVRIDNTLNALAVKEMMARGMCELTGAPHPYEAWQRFFGPGDVVGIKVNPVGKGRPGYVGAISNKEVLLEVVLRLRDAGVKPADIIVFERYANEFRDAGYEKLMTERIMDGVRWLASSSGYDDTQLNIDGFANRRDERENDPHVAGYDPDVFVSMGYCHPRHRPQDDRRFRSHLSAIVTRMVNKIITLPVLKDHRSAGVTLALKNMSHGFNNNVARSHISGMKRLGGAVSCPNQCDTFIPTAAGQLTIRQKATLHILDGLIGVYEGGPGNWNKTWGTWRRQSLFFATDPVALDHVGWDIIDVKRVEQGWQPVAQMGQLQQPQAAMLSARLAALATTGLPQSLASAAVGQHAPGIQDSEQFDRRQPEHIALAGLHGLGVFDADRIEHRVIRA